MNATQHAHRRHMGLTAFDLFILGNFILWSLVILFGYRWRRLEFYVYVLLVLFQAAGMLAVWAGLRRLAFPRWLLVLLEVAILLHLTGGSMFIRGVRLYDLYLLPDLAVPVWFTHLTRYDKLVHAYFAAVGTVGLRHMWPRLGMGEVRRAFDLVIVGLVVLGVCVLVESAEYVGTKLVHLPEVGGYDNNLQDLLANLVGTVAAGAGVFLAGRRAPESGGAA